MHSIFLLRYLSFLFLWSPGQKIQQSEIQTPSKEDMYLKYHMANKTYFTTYLTFNKQIDQCKQKPVQNPFIKEPKNPNPQLQLFKQPYNYQKKYSDFLKKSQHWEFRCINVLTNQKVWGHRFQELIWVNSNGKDEVGKITSNYLFLPLKNNEFGTGPTSERVITDFMLRQTSTFLIHTTYICVHECCICTFYVHTYLYSITLCTWRIN